MNISSTIQRSLSPVTDIFRKNDKRVKAEISLLLILCMLVLMMVSWEEIAHNHLTGEMEKTKHGLSG
jgi:transposase